MPPEPKSVLVRTLTRSQTAEQGLEFTWSRQLGGSVEVSSRELNDEETEATADSPEGAASGNVFVEVEVEVSSDEEDEAQGATGGGEGQAEEAADSVLQ